MTSAPTISVIIPMYNAEKYIAECLDSVLVQTFQDFEVILVNDASTDGSRQIAESYLEKFGGRLAIYDNQKNLGVSATRNKGLEISRGEYVFFMDADDLILPNGLKRLYGLAKSFDVDVVNCTGHYDLSDDGKERKLRRLKKPTATLENIIDVNLEWRVKGLLEDNFYWAPWRRLSRRDFLIRNGIFFPEGIEIYGDRIWTFGLLFCAQKILHTPLAVYFYRKSVDSLSRRKITALQNVNVFINVIVRGLTWIDSLMDKILFFKTVPQYRYEILSHVAQRYFEMLYKVSLKAPQTEIYRSVKKTFGKNFGDYDVLISVLLTLVNSFQKADEKNKMRLIELEEQLQGEEKNKMLLSELEEQMKGESS